MHLTGTENNLTLLREFGNRIRDTRIAMSLTQKELAERAGLSQKTIERVERGESIKFDSVLNILRVLRCLEFLDLLVPEQTGLSVDEYLRGKKRKRASARRQIRDQAWKWGDEL